MDMSLRFTFIALCATVVCVILLLVLKKSFLENTDKSSQYFRSRESNILLNTSILIQPNCGSSFLIWVVTSSAEGLSSRIALRRAYPSEELDQLGVRRVFLLGIPAKKETRIILPKESRRHQDILQGDFLEAYRNLTLKHLMGLNWATKNCAARFLIKTDDDVVLDLFRVLKLLREGSIKEQAVSGYALKNMLPIRTPGNKWFVSRDEYPGDMYPDFLSGWFYITSLEIAAKLVRRSTFSEFFWIDDVFITGILRQDCGIEIQKLNSYYTTDYRYLECCIRGKRKKLRCEFIAGPDGGKKELQMEFKEFSAFCRLNCSDRVKNQSVARTCVAAYEQNLEVQNSKAQIHPLGN